MWASDKKFLVTAANGQLGSQLLADNTESNIIALSRKELDIADPQLCERVLRKLSPDVIVNCAAWTAVDAAETQQQETFLINAEGPKMLADWCVNNNAYLLHISTDYVFSGAKPLYEPYIETDSPDPTSVYGQSKLQGEKNIQAAGSERYSILRTAWLYGANGKNFLKAMLRLVLSDPQKEFKVVDDQFGSPTSVDALARQIKVVAKAEAYGLYHASAHGYCSWYELACEFFALLDVDHNLVPCTTTEFPTPAKRPVNSILGNQHLQDQGIDVFLSWQDELRLFVDAYGERLVDEVKP